MKQAFAVVLFNLLFLTTYAQAITANDSVSTGYQNAQMSFYSLSTGLKTNCSATDWHLAITVRHTQFPSAPLGGTTIRLNGGMGVKVYLVPNTTSADFNTIDTTGWQSWRRLYDSDSLLDLGAFNTIRNPGNIFDFGWGKYNQTTHNVVADSVFVVQLPNGALKKFMVVALVYDTAFDIRYADINNDNLTNVHISKAQYTGKEFVYLNMLTNNVMDKEPASTDWDLLFTRYAATDVALKGTAKTGVLANKGITIAREPEADITSNQYSGLNFSSNMNTIGWNWQSYDSTYSVYHVKDSLAYFVKALDGSIYKMVFTGFGGNETGEVSFYQELVSSATAIDNTPSKPSFSLYPNPSNNVIYINQNQSIKSKLQIFNLSGQLIDEATATDALTAYNTSQLPAGLYILAATTNGTTSYQKFAVAH